MGLTKRKDSYYGEFPVLDNGKTLTLARGITGARLKRWVRREALQERSWWIRQAPQLVSPLELLIPIYRNGERAKWLVGAGIRLYDLLALESGFPRGRWYRAGEVVERFHPASDATSCWAPTVTGMPAWMITGLACGPRKRPGNRGPGSMS